MPGQSTIKQGISKLEIWEKGQDKKTEIPKELGQKIQRMKHEAKMDFSYLKKGGFSP